MLNSQANSVINLPGRPSGPAAFLTFSFSEHCIPLGGSLAETCNSEHFQCQSGHTLVCLPTHLVCNGYPNCLDQKDEESCEFCGKRDIRLDQWTSNVTVTTPRYPDEYPNMLVCVWHVTNNVADSSIKLSFLDFMTELYFDNLTLWFGSDLNENLAIEFGGEYPPETVVIPKEEHVWIQFVSKGWDTYRGFVIGLTLQPNTDPLCNDGQFVCESGVGCLHDDTVCDGTALCLDATDEQCDVCDSGIKILHKDSKYNLTTPLYPRTYPDYLDCQWVISASDNGHIIVTFLAFDTEFYYDFINIGSGPVVTGNSTEHRFSGSDAPNKVSVGGFQMWIQFTSDRRYAEPGVLMEIEWSIDPVVCRENEFGCFSTMACLDASLKCDGVSHCMDNSDENDCDLCGYSEIEITTDQAINISSPLYPELYPNSMDCKWIITTIDGFIRIEFEFFRVQKGYDYLFVGEGDTIILEMSGTESEVPKSVIVHHSTMWLSFFSTTSWNDEGFFAYVKTVEMNATCSQGEFTCNLERALFCLLDESKCDGRAICPDQADEKNCGTCGARNIYIEYGDVKNLTSANYPGNYLTDLLCSYLVESVEGTPIVIDIMDFDLERNYDFLIIGDGEDPSDAESTIATLTGMVKIRRIVSLEHQIWIKFVSDRTGTRRGFDIHIRDWNTAEICHPNDIDCGNRVCVSVEARCNGFNDCVNSAEESQCENIHCPDSYKCDVSNDLSEALKCVAMETVCDGNRDCPMGDDETECDIKRCPLNCRCKYSTPGTSDKDQIPVFQVNCQSDWTDETISNLARTAHILSLAGNSINEIRTRTFDGLLNLTWLDLSKNNITTLENRVFEELAMLETLYVDDHHLCCHFHNLEHCITLEPQPPLFMCGSLMQNSLLRVSMWILGISALVGNIGVCVWRFQETTKSKVAAIQSFLIGNLAVSDFMMGVYMVMIAGADVYFGEEYFLYSDGWRSGIVCRIAGFLSLLSSEASVFLITLITIDRFICLQFPFSRFRLRLSTARIVVGILWCIAVVLSVVPVIFAGPESDLYDLSDVCIGLPLITRPSSYQILESDIGNHLSDDAFSLSVPNDSKPAWYFSIAIFLGLNLLCFVAIFMCYVKIFWTVKQSKKQVNRSDVADEDIKMALKMAAIVGTDFCCWVPVILMGILSQTGAVVIPLQMYTWSVVFILPINSSINPYLYTIASVVSSQKEKRTSKSVKETIVTSSTASTNVVI
ncbi:uncharacterized protein [Amphiura filiformis]|uniref:uncharacterized protein n=1 Tax=Amphiura filiformis TaxID=82378 RepID=UPI003B20C3BC